MTDQRTPDVRPQPVHGRRTRTVVALIGLLFSMGVPAVVLGSPVPTVDGHPADSLTDPAGLGVTGAMPGDPLPGDLMPGGSGSGNAELDSAPGAGIELPGIATPPLPDGPLGIPGAVLDAYHFAERTLADVRPRCHLSWSVLAGIGRIESDHASAGRVDAFGNTLGPILGPRLDGSPGMAAIPDTDHGLLDADQVWDRAVGPMQFIPASWRGYGVDGNGDGVANPNNVYDATIAAGIYLCAGGTDLSDPAQLHAAIYRYNHSASYVVIVLQWAQAYLTGFVPTPSAPGPIPPGINGNGGRLILPSATRPVAPIAQPTALAATPLPTSSVLPASPSPTTTTAPAPTSSSPSPEPTPTPPAAPTTTLPTPALPTTAPPAPESTLPSATTTVPPATTTTPAVTTPPLPSPPATDPTSTVVAPPAP